LFLSAASLVEIEAVIERIRQRDAKRADALQAWLDGLIKTFWDRIHPVDVNVAIRAGRLLPHRQQSDDARHRFHDAVLTATAQIHGAVSTVAVCHVSTAPDANRLGGTNRDT
jgi:hypothetical protein